MPIAFDFPGIAALEEAAAGVHQATTLADMRDAREHLLEVMLGVLQEEAEFWGF